MRIAFVLFLLTIRSLAPVEQTQAAKPIDYETFCAIADPDAKRQAFIATPAENKAVLARTQIERFMAANRARLTPLQNDYLLEVLKHITPESYSGAPRSADAQTQLKDLENRMIQLFSRDDGMALQPSGPCQPKGTRASSVTVLQ